MHRVLMVKTTTECVCVCMWDLRKFGVTKGFPRAGAVVPRKVLDE